jgi:hypothetical protein
MSPAQQAVFSICHACARFQDDPTPSESSTSDNVGFVQHVHMYVDTRPCNMQWCVGRSEPLNGQVPFGCSVMYCYHPRSNRAARML